MAFNFIMIIFATNFSGGSFTLSAYAIKNTMHLRKIAMLLIRQGF